MQGLQYKRLHIKKGLKNPVKRVSSIVNSRDI